MAIVTYAGIAYPCATALKGSDYVHLLNADGKLTVAFDGVTNFNGFSITGGSWKTPANDHDCYVAVVREDGAVGKGGHKCSSLLAFFKGTSVTLPASGWKSSSVATAEQTISVSGMTATIRPLVDLDMSKATAANGSALQAAWGNIGRVVSGNGTLTFYAYGSKPSVDLPVFI